MGTLIAIGIFTIWFVVGVWATYCSRNWAASRWLDAALEKLQLSDRGWMVAVAVFALIAAGPFGLILFAWIQWGERLLD